MRDGGTLVTPSRGLVWGYGVGSIANSAVATVPPLLLLYYLTQIVGVPPAAAGLALLLPQLFEFVATPMIGVYADRAKRPRESRRRMLFAGLVATCIGIGALFSVPDIGGWGGQLAAVTLVFCVVVVASSLFAVPYLALPAEMSCSENDRTRLVAARMTFVMIGILLSGSIAQPIVEFSGGGREGYQTLSVFLACLCGVTMLVTFFATRRAVQVDLPAVTGPLFAQMQRALEDKAFLIICIAYLAQAVGIGCSLGAWPFFATYVVGDEGAVAAMFATAMCAAALSTPLWGLASRHWGKPFVYSLGVAIYIAGYTLLFTASEQLSGMSLIVSMVIVGIGTGALQLVPFAYVADLTNRAAARSAQVMAGSVNGLWIAVEKGGFALSGLALGVVLAVFGFIEGGGEQSTRAVTGVLFASTLLPASLIAISAIILSFNDEWRRGAFHPVTERAPT